MPTPPPDREERILGIIETARAKRAKFRDERITMAHGAGGKATQSMIEGLFVPAFGAQASTEATRRRSRSTAPQLALTTDSFVVKPLRFPGGSIGDLAVNGTVNDLAVAGARPLALTPLADPRGGPGGGGPARRGGGDRRRRRRRPGVQIVAGDTKVVERGARRRRCTSAPPASGERDPRARLSPDAIRPGDRVLLSGTIGEHGTAIMLARGEFELDADDRVRHALAVAGRRRAAGGRRARRCAACATRPAAAWPRC